MNNAIYQRNHRLRKIEQGICVWHGCHEPAAENVLRCHEHARLHAQRERERYGAAAALYAQGHRHPCLRCLCKMVAPLVRYDETCQRAVDAENLRRKEARKNAKKNP